MRALRVAGAATLGAAGLALAALAVRLAADNLGQLPVRAAAQSALRGEPVSDGVLARAVEAARSREHLAGAAAPAAFFAGQAANVLAQRTTDPAARWFWLQQADVFLRRGLAAQPANALEWGRLAHVSVQLGAVPMAAQALAFSIRTSPGEVFQAPWRVAIGLDLLPFAPHLAQPLATQVPIAAAANQTMLSATIIHHGADDFARQAMTATPERWAALEQRLHRDRGGRTPAEWMEFQRRLARERASSGR